MHFRLLLIMEANTVNPDQTAPKGSSLIWVHYVCNIGYQSTQADVRVDVNCCGILERVNCKVSA